ncbi:hypothetical protein Ae717Ps2_3577c [Pseudonocardia sp. Ae717_Ps2]|uniref:hypothetical protein n=1 Tax=Pseudonocardia sp. Ae717_Ps2 TaxID=1885573 RepID=UPI000966746A|nr:hypothetical protein [Pseudonocardia sp. Ae717_Ps2]OLM32681.1 hypothetical protein Ae717Ps2_3577c [Pseudonocardia sp. Ae717_Ps2]
MAATDEMLSPDLVEVLSGSAFGFELVDDRPLFNPPGWTPLRGISQALRILGFDYLTESFESRESGLLRLRELLVSGLVIVGPLDMGMLGYHPGAEGPIGADHYVVAVDINESTIVVHDPDGFPYAHLPVSTLLDCWGSHSLPYSSEVRHLWARIGREDPAVSRGEAVRAFVCEIPHHYIFAADGELSSARHMRDFAQRIAADGAGDAIRMLAHFSLRVGARRRLDAANVLSGWATLSSLLDEQARCIGRMHLDAAMGDRYCLATRFEQLADLESRLYVAAIDARACDRK